MKNASMSFAAASIATLAFAAQASAENESAPVLYDAAPSVVEAKIDETPIPAVVRTAVMPVKPMDVAGAMPAALIEEKGSNAVAAIETDRGSVIQFGSGEIDIKAGTFNDVDRGKIVNMQPKDTGAVLDLNEDVAAGDFYYGQDGKVYQFIGMTN